MQVHLSASMRYLSLNGSGKADRLGQRTRQSSCRWPLALRQLGSERQTADDILWADETAVGLEKGEMQQWVGHPGGRVEGSRGLR